MSKYLKIAQINQENYISNSLAASRYPPEKNSRTSKHHFHHASMRNNFGAFKTLALGSCLIASLDFAMIK